MTSRRHRCEAGFTLLETLVALVLLGLLTAFLIAGLRVGRSYLQAVTAQAEPADAAATVQDLLRRMLEESYPALSYSERGMQPVFDGLADRLTFATEVPTQLGRGGYFRVELYLESGNLLIRWEPEQGQGTAFQGKDARGPYKLLDHVEAMRFRYFGALPPDKPGWTDRWYSIARSPTLVRMDITRAGGPGIWPVLVAGLRTDVDVTCVFDALFHRCKGR